MRSPFPVLFALAIIIALVAWLLPGSRAELRQSKASHPALLEKSDTLARSGPETSIPAAANVPEPRWIAISGTRERWQLALKQKDDALAMLEYCRTQVAGVESLWCARQSTESCFRFPGRGPERVAKLEKELVKHAGWPAADFVRTQLRWCRRLWLADPAVAGSAEQLDRKLLEQAHPVAVVLELTGNTSSEIKAIDDRVAERLRSAWLSGDPDAIEPLLLRCLSDDAPFLASDQWPMALVDCRLRGSCKSMPAFVREWCRDPERASRCPPESADYEEWLSRQMPFDTYRRTVAFADGMMASLVAQDAHWPVIEKCLARR